MTLIVYAQTYVCLEVLGLLLLRTHVIFPGQVVLTEKERRDSELEHQRVLEECRRVIEQYKATERRLHTHIVKSR